LVPGRTGRGPEDFERLRAKIAKRCGPVRLGNEVQRVRTVFKYAYDAAWIEKPVRFGPDFRKPNRRVLRMVRHASGEQMFEAQELQQIIRAAGIQESIGRPI